MDITALFNDADSAEHALVNLRALGISPTRYKISAFHSQNTAPRPIFTMSVSGGNPSPGREVQLLLTVEDSAAHRTQSALISNYARKVRMVQAHGPPLV